MSEQRTVKDTILLFALLLIAAAAGYLGRAWEESRKQQTALLEAPPDGMLTIPAEVELTIGEPPREVRAETHGRRVIWQSLDAELSVAPYTPKSVWVWAAKAGDYRLQAWSAVDGLPTQNSICTVKVRESKAKGSKE